MGIRHRRFIKLRRTVIDELPIQNRSGLVWDQDVARLYVVSDNGHIVHLQPEFDGGHHTAAAIKK
jgi:hypothetical protein